MDHTETLTESDAPRVVSQALLIPDILDTIFEITNNGQRTKAALVCKTWSDLALDWIWKDVTLFALLKLVYPLHRLDEGWDFKTDGMGKGKWDRFHSYACRVHSLTHNDATDMDGHDSLITYQMMVLLMAHMSTTSEKVLLPKVKTIQWIAKRDRTPLQLIPFISPTLKDLTVRLASSVTSESTSRFLIMLSDVPAMTQLQSFQLETKLDVEGDLRFSAALTDCLVSQHNLATLKLDECYISPSVVSALGKRSNLIAANTLVAPLSGEDFQKLTVTLVASFPQLQRLHLLVPAAFVDPTEDMVFSKRIEPLLQCSGLLELQIFRRHATPLTVADIRAMGRAWPQMETLNINANVENGQEDGRGTPFRFLEEFSSSFSPALKKLAHYYTFDDDLPTPDLIASKFPSLRVISVGNSAIPDDKVSSVGEFLAGICPSGTMIACTDDGNYRQAVFRTEWTGSSGKQNWVTVKLLVEMERRIHGIYKLKAESALKETESLKTRVTTLEQNFASFQSAAPPAV